MKADERLQEEKQKEKDLLEKANKDIALLEERKKAVCPFIFVLLCEWVGRGSFRLVLFCPPPLSLLPPSPIILHKCKHSAQWATDKKLQQFRFSDLVAADEKKMNEEEVKARIAELTGVSPAALEQPGAPAEVKEEKKAEEKKSEEKKEAPAEEEEEQEDEEEEEEEGEEKKEQKQLTPAEKKKKRQEKLAKLREEQEKLEASLTEQYTEERELLNAAFAPRLQGSSCPALSLFLSFCFQLISLVCVVLCCAVRVCVLCI